MRRKTSDTRLARPILAGVLAGVLAGCAGMGATTFVHPSFNFDYVERVAVVSIENLTGDQGAGARATRYLVSELLATEAFDVVEPGEVTRALSANGVLDGAQITEEQAKAVGKELRAQGLFVGSIGESATVRSGSASSNYVTISLRMIETDTGQTVWSTTHTEGGRGFWSSLFGTGTPSIGEVTRRCVEKCVGTLVN